MDMSKKLIFCVLVIFQLHFNYGSCFINPYPKIQEIPVKNIDEKPLILTPLIEAGKIKEARKASLVLPLKGDNGIKSYSGYFTVNKNFNSNLFFWFFPSLSNPRRDSVVLWLQGGPGATSLYGLFAENGPFSINTKNILVPRNYTWAKNHNLIYIDNPVGTGYSFTTEGYARNETAVGNDLYVALIQFFKLFPELQKNPFFITGESYGGKYVPAASYAINKNNKIATQKINFQGVAIGNGWTDPIHQINYGDYLYQIGLIDNNTREIFHQQEDLARKYMKEKKYVEANSVIDKLIDGDTYPYGSLFYNVTGFTFYMNFLHSKEEQVGGDMGKYVQQPAVRHAIHVGNAKFNSGIDVERNLLSDIMKSVKSWVEEMLEHYRVLIYNGQLDIIVSYPLTESYLSTLKWSAAEEYKNASRFPWRVGDDIAGYVKTAGNLTEILVRNAGHLVPADQPKWAFDLINRFTANKPYH